jgi:ketosteroid isomerase-like protein
MFSAMKKLTMPLVSLLVLLTACTQKEESLDRWKQEIVDTEKAFSAMAQSDGIAEAFLSYAAEDAVLMRNNTLVKGKEAMKDLLLAEASENVSLVWEPDFVDVSASGDLGYTYGKFTYTLTDSLGKNQVMEGVFHTVWKRQADGTWKFVWD